MSDAETVVGRMINALNEHDLDRAMRFFSGDVVGVGPGGQAEGHAEVASYYTAFVDAFPDVRMTVWSTVARDDLVVVEGMYTGTHRGPVLLPGGGSIEATGQGISLRACVAFTVKDDQIVSYQSYYDQLELFARLGAKLVPAIDGPCCNTSPHGSVLRLFQRRRR
ncbi:ester cyclase [Planotetraspora sp. A-T 1434]|uniref:ester cyclase n=1 Tax=Planotetraspora sp. A-T 1434 TaxID=2979219 RepID=UPI0021BFDD0D|nr:ester cyclase [Planotetraspora sp. A-T 1434]MCT9930823.1 ester cyclase [Planotetraspora sp. A-T 1434]